MPIDTARQLQDLLRTAEAFRAATIEHGALVKIPQNLYIDELRALESALSPINYVVPETPPIEKPPLAKLIDQMRNWPAADGKDGLSGTYVERLLRQASDELECWSIVEQLRAPEGDEVRLFCDNPDPETPARNNALECVGYWTNWKPRRFEGETLLEALRTALAARDAHEAIGKATQEPSCGRRGGNCQCTSIEECARDRG